MGPSQIAVASHQRSPDFAALPVMAFVAKQQTALWHAARLLGGYEAARLVDRCAELLEQERLVTTRVRGMLDQLLQVLTLEHVHDPDLPHMGYFAVIDPIDPVVEEICHLANGLRDVLAQFEVRRDWAETRRMAKKAI